MGFFDRFRTKAATAVEQVSEQVEVQKSLSDLGITSASDLAAFFENTRNTFSTSFDYTFNVREAYLQNPVAFYCINLIADAAVQPRWELYLNDKEVTDAPTGNNPLRGIHLFLERPNDRQTLREMIRLMVIQYLLAGEVFLYRIPNAKAFGRGNGKVMLIEANRVSVQQNSYSIDGTVVVPKQNEDGSRDMLHIAEWHPFGESTAGREMNRGLSRLQPAWSAIANYNAAQKWNHSVLSNSAKMSIVAILKSFVTGKGSTLNQAQMQDLNKDLASFASPKGRGKPMVMSGDWELKELGMNNQELEWLNGMDSMARAIALAFGVDPVMLSLPGDSTYSNKKEAYAQLFKTVAHPKVLHFLEIIEHWMKEVAPGDWHFKLNLDDVIHLEADFEKKWTRQKEAADILSVNERRELLGYQPVPDGDKIASIKVEPTNPPVPPQQQDQNQQPPQQAQPTTNEGNNDEAV